MKSTFNCFKLHSLSQNSSSIRPGEASWSLRSPAKCPLLPGYCYCYYQVIVIVITRSLLLLLPGCCCFDEDQLSGEFRQTLGITNNIAQICNNCIICKILINNNVKTKTQTQKYQNSKLTDASLCFGLLSTRASRRDDTTTLLERQGFPLRHCQVR